MSNLLHKLHLAPESGHRAPPGLVAVQGGIELEPQCIAETVARNEARLLEGTKSQKNIGIDYILFRRFGDERSSQVAAYVLDNSHSRYSRDEIAELHCRVWLNGSAPLLYVEWPSHVDILKCAAEPLFWNKRADRAEYTPSETIETVSEVSKALDAAKVRRFSAYRLSNGTFWEDPENADWAKADKASHKALIKAVVDTDRILGGKKNPIMRRMLLLAILSKYLEDRGVFPKDWFAQFEATASDFRSVLKSGKTQSVLRMLKALRDKFNGDIFDLDTCIEASLDKKTLTHFVTLLEANTVNKQMYLWKQYSFNYIPIEVLSHLYQHFAQEGKGAVFTPPFVADLMLDHAMPFDGITGHERVLDPTCGSGIFLVGAFRRLIHHWQSQHDWGRPGVPVLKKILRNSIFGVEDSPEAAHIASFNLALAMCDALQPKVIWKDLRFDKLIDRNLFVGDFFVHASTLRENNPEGFTTILGNPPSLSKLTKAALETRPMEKRKIPIPDGQMAYRVAEEAMTLLRSDGCLCLIEPHGFLYNAKARKFLADFLTSNTVETVLDFVSIRKLFEGADPKTVAIVAKPGAPEADHTIVHQTFRRTKSVHERIGFELDHYDHHIIEQYQVLRYPIIWRANLLGGGRLKMLASRISELPTLSDFFEEKKWTHGEGLIFGEKSKKTTAKWLKDKIFIPSQSLKETGVDKDNLQYVKEIRFSAPRKIERFTPPMVLIRANEKLQSDFWGCDEGVAAFPDKIISVNAPEKEQAELKRFHQSFRKNNKQLRALALLKSSQILVGKSTAFLKSDIVQIPWTSKGQGLGLAWWEELLLMDSIKFYSEIIRVGQNSTALRVSVSQSQFAQYAKTFIKLLGSVYTNLRPGKSGIFSGLAFQAFYFGESCELDWPEDWADKLESVVFKGEGTSLQTTRVLRFYEKNTLIIIKPDRLRHWLGSTAIRDADETLVDLQQQGF